MHARCDGDSEASRNTHRAGPFAELRGARLGVEESEPGIAANPESALGIGTDGEEADGVEFGRAGLEGGGQGGPARGIGLADGDSPVGGRQ